MKKILTRKGAIHFLITGLLIMLVLGGIVYFSRPLRLPDDGKHKDLSSKFVCLGCHNKGRAGGSSLVFHYEAYACLRCHYP